MRALGAMLAVAAFLGMSGCAFPGETSSTSSQSPLFGVCPQWVQGAGQHAGTVALGAGATQQDLILPPALVQEGRALDLVRIEIDVDEALDVQLRATRASDNGTAGAGLNLVDYRGDAPRPYPVVSFDRADHDLVFDLYLSAVAQGSSAQASPVALHWTVGNGTLAASYTATFHYRVCGAPI